MDDTMFQVLMKLDMPRLGYLDIDFNFLSNDAVDAIVQSNFTNLTALFMGTQLY